MFGLAGTSGTNPMEDMCDYFHCHCQDGCSDVTGAALPTWLAMAPCRSVKPHSDSSLVTCYYGGAMARKVIHTK